jgi:hypothetical protein
MSDDPTDRLDSADLADLAASAKGRGRRPATPSSYRALCRLASQQHGVVSRVQCGELGMSAKVLRRLVSDGALTKLLPDVFAVGGPPDTWHRRLMAGVLQLGRSSMVAGRAAAALHGFDTFKAGPLEFLVPIQSWARLPTGTVHTSALIHDVDRGVVQGIPCTTPLRTAFDLAGLVGARRLEHVVDSGLRDRHFTDAELSEVLARLRRSGRPGVRRFEDAIVIADGPVATSVLERRFLRIMASGGLPTPSAQVVHRDDERFVARVDFAFEGTPVIVEVEGHATHTTRRQRQHDAERRTDLENLGKHVLVFTYEDVRDRAAYVLSQVRRALRAHGRPAGAAA